MSVSHDNLIIDAGHQLTLLQRLLSMTFTTLLWLFWVYLWMPLISLVGWYFGFQLFYDEMVLHEGWYSLVKLLLIYALIVAVLGGLLILWARINYLRFSRKERRRPVPNLSPATQARDFGVVVDEVSHGRSSQISVVHHDQEGQIVKIEPRIPHPTQSGRA
jgi:biofilm PGA synthesis protein PgaD